MRYRLQRHDGTDCSATMVPITVLRMVPIQRYRQIFQQAYSSVYGGNPIIHWIFFKDADNIEEAKEGIMTKDEYQKMEKQ